MEVKWCIVLAACLVVACSGEVPTDAPIAKPTHPHPTTTTAPPTSPVTPSTMTAPHTSTATPVTTTASPTSTVTPSTTTAPPTSTVAPSTTTAPPTSTVAPVTTTPKPEPKPETGKWSFVDNKSNKTCIIMQMALQFNLSYPVKNDAKQAVFNLPVDQTSTKDGYCGDSAQNITLTWLSDKNGSNIMTFSFDKNATSNKFTLSSITATIYEDSTNFPNSNSADKPHIFEHTDTIFTTPLTMSYRCGKVQNFTMSGNTSLIFIDNVQMQAFHADKGATFGSAVDCDYADVPDIVPIAVGCALGALVLIVLIAYLVGRRRNRARGYLSM